MSPPPKRARRVPRPASGSVALRTDAGTRLSLPMGPEMQRAAMAWSYVVRNRQRWLAQEGAREQQAERARRHLQVLGLAQGDLEALERARVVEVSIPYRGEAVGWEGRVLPWESLLSAATRRRRPGPLVVVRRLERVEGKAARVAPATQPAMVVESAPGDLAEVFDFDLERRLVEASLRPRRIEIVESPDAAALTARIAAAEPSIVHVAGLDAREGWELFDLPDPGQGEGFLLAGPSGQPAVASPTELARIVTAGKRKPRLLVCSFGSSAARIAALAVAEGCEAALGFQDELDEALMEAFLADFYAAWRLTEGEALRSFEAALSALRGRASLTGAGLVLWSASPLLPSSREAAFVMPAPRPARKGTARDLIGVEARPLPRLNYALLHNDRDLFDSFRLLNYSGGRIEDVSVEVVLHAGSESLPYRARLDLEGPVTELRGRVRVPLTSALARSVREAVHTTLQVTVSWRGEVAYSDTHRVTLLPADEWRDDDRDRLWLPSFVLPRDPGVERIVTAAERYLRVLRDDASAGFDGYQSRNPDAADPDAGVDAQAQALWSAIAHDLGLAYVNPPPTYTPESQRLRTPTQVLAGRKGTCIDLALLLAACFESVDIYPVLFLAEGHAFPGYWRGSEAHAVFERVERPEAEGPPDEATAPGQRVAWQIRRDGHREVLARVDAGELVPLEAVALTRRGSFREARALGLERLRGGERFEAMVDVVLARRNGVTPVPIREDEA